MEAAREKAGQGKRLYRLIQFSSPGTHPLVYLLPLGLIFDTVGYMPPHLRLLLIYLLLALPLCVSPSRRSLGGGVILAATMIIQAVVHLPGAADIALLLLAHQLLWAATHPVPSRLTTGVLVYACLHLCLFLSPLGFQVLDGLANAGAALSSHLTGTTVNLGYTYQGIGALLLFLCLSISGWDRSRVSLGRTASFLVIALLIHAFLAVLLVNNVNFGAELTWELSYREVFDYTALFAHVKRMAVIAFPALAFLTYAIAYVILHHGNATGGDTTASSPPGIKHVWLPTGWTSWSALAAAILVVIIVLPPTTRQRAVPLKVTLVERGVVSYTKPDYKRFGRAAGGMYGMLPEYMRLFGCSAEIVPDIPETLDTDQVLMLTNLDEPLTPAVHRRIWRFVAEGGKLWVLGDHTFIKNGRNHVNDLLAPCHIRLRHDSAQFFPQGWFNSYRFRQGTHFASLEDAAENRPAILVGASLALEGPALPFIVGRFGYSDWGTAESDERRGFIGDFEYQPHERLGDLVLVAGEHFGKGKVLVFGDTTSFFNNNLSRSYEILRASLSWLGTPRSWLTSGQRSTQLAAAAGLVILIVLLALSRKAPPTAPLLAVLCIMATILHGASGYLSFDHTFARSQMAVIDFSHQPYASKHGSMNSGLHGVSINLMRHGNLPVAINHWDRDVLDAAALVVLNAPRRPVSARESHQLRAFMQRGGTVLLGCGYPHYEHIRPLLDMFGLSIRGLPLGRFFDRTAFGYPISFVSAWPISVDTPDADVLCAYNEWPLIVSVPVGTGRLVLIADSEFLQNRNLEGHEQHDPANVRFIRLLLDSMGAAP